MLDQVHISQLIWSVVYAALGMVLFIIAYWLIERLLPFPVRKEIEEDQNTALGVIIGAFIIGIAIIIAAAIV